MNAPGSVNHTDQHYHFFFADTSEAGAETRAKSINGTLSVVREDYEVCVSTHRNYLAGGYTPGPLSSRHEKGVQYFQSRVAQALNL